MAAFAIEIYRPGITEASVRVLAAEVKRAVRALREAGVFVRYVGSTLSPVDEVCFVRLEGDAGVIAQLVRGLGMNDARITEIVDVGPGDDGPS